MKREEERNRKKGNRRKEVKKLAADERNTHHKFYRHEDEKFLFHVQSSLHGLGEEKLLSEGNAGSYPVFRNRWSTQES